MARFGEPEDVEGECNAHLHIADNHGDNHATMRCQLEPGHDMDNKPTYHQETWPSGSGECTVTWPGDDRPCEACDGLGVVKAPGPSQLVPDIPEPDPRGHWRDCPDCLSQYLDPDSDALTSSPGEPVCPKCSDTHMMDYGDADAGEDRKVMCTGCPTPCEECRGGPYRAFCKETPCPCICHVD